MKELYYNEITGRGGRLIVIEIYGENLDKPVRMVKGKDLDDFEPGELQEIAPRDRITIRKTKELNDEWMLILDMPDYTDEQLDNICKNFK